ncbi:cytochrome b [Aquamicrobium segne]|uniref:Cytochrome b n=1 Tax=Aquamicrobium segne TaxID=469547 RepID=A0ABW0H146_9HYPH
MTKKMRYSNIQIALHWTVAVLVVGQYLFNEPIAQAWNAAADGLPVSFNPLILAHVAGGVLILALVVWRLVLKSQRAAPPPPDNEPALLRMVAHWSLYGLLAAMSMSGMAAWFGGVEAAATAHGVLKVPLIALIALHLLAVIFHHLILRNPILKRMV